MSRIAYIHGAFVPQADAWVSMEDRGYQFADGIYEVVPFIARTPLNMHKHLTRFARSLAELGIAEPVKPSALLLLIRELIRRNARDEGLVYIQVTRGAAARNHTWSANLKPVLSMSVLPTRMASAQQRTQGVKVITAPDERWARCDIKSIALLPNILARDVSYRQGLRETWLVNAQSQITEGTATNAYIVDAQGMIITHPATHAILGGVTREVTLELARMHQLRVEERPFTRAELAQAREAFLTSASSFVLPVIAVDGTPVGDGKVGKVTAQLSALYQAAIAAQLPIKKAA
jgi:D-alanine transaminase